MLKSIKQKMNQMAVKWTQKKFLAVEVIRNERGATLLEYVALAVFVFGFLAAAIVTFRGELNTIFTEIQTALGTR